MPQWAGSCWYYLRFTDPENSEQFASKEAENYWMGENGIDLYVGGVEQALSRRREVTRDSAANIAWSDFIALAVADVIDIRIQNLTDGNNITVVDANVTVEQID